MNTFFDEDNPWLVVHSDADVLEDWYQRLLKLGEQNGIQERVLLEQRELEHRARRAARKLEERVETVEEWEESEFEPESLRGLLKDVSSCSLLYRHSASWAKNISVWAETLAVSQNRFSAGALRAALHAAVVPVKIHFATAEEEADSPLASGFASVEYGLARAYVGAALGALRDVSKVFPEAQLHYAEGCLLKEQLLKTERRLEATGSLRFRDV